MGRHGMQREKNVPDRMKKKNRENKRINRFFIIFLWPSVGARRTRCLHFMSVGAGRKLFRFPFLFTCIFFLSCKLIFPSGQVGTRVYLFIIPVGCSNQASKIKWKNHHYSPGSQVQTIDLSEWKTGDLLS